MDANNCRALVLYMPVWKPTAYLDEVPALISETEWLKQLVNGITVLSRCPETMTRRMFNACLWNMYETALRGQPAQNTRELRAGERYEFMDYKYVSSLWGERPAIALQLSYDIGCRWICPCPCHKAEQFEGSPVVRLGRTCVIGPAKGPGLDKIDDGACELVASVSRRKSRDSDQANPCGEVVASVSASKGSTVAQRGSVKTIEKKGPAKSPRKRNEEVHFRVGRGQREWDTVQRNFGDEIHQIVAKWAPERASTDSGTNFGGLEVYPYVPKRLSATFLPPAFLTSYTMPVIRTVVPSARRAQPRPITLATRTAEETVVASALLLLRSRLFDAGRSITLRDRTHLAHLAHDENKENVDPSSVPTAGAGKAKPERRPLREMEPKPERRPLLEMEPKPEPRTQQEMELKSEPRTLQDIALGSDSESEGTSDQEQEESDGGHAECDFCGVVCDTDQSPPAHRFFFCDECGTHCSSCCHDLHVVHPLHELQEWDAATQSWSIAQSFAATGLQETSAVDCSSCCQVIAPMGVAMPVGTLFCAECHDGLFCLGCCLEDHAEKPLHWLKRWTGSDWEATTLRDVGLVYQMGHGGRPCAQPQGFVSPLTVISLQGCNFLRVRYCDCGKFGHLQGRMGSMGRWEQIIYNGWHTTTLEAEGVCSTFVVHGAGQ
ncbi:hypothetical protein C8F04DRAFT_1191699 [Mycena alexandri]|uniref:CxC2-like cysteine cluster KDZ transposase-associated domain-containing protein n=1 Tax=Mycena alexandri TaxID=1745969 RepID=A0AAD6WXU9_9AGAR|nr:hypothetical protein C8F04DRAFT_1191699 [Mycena alexandri]